MRQLIRLFLSINILAATMSIHSKSFALGGDMVNNGGGIAEKNVLFAYDKLNKYLQLCLNSDACKLNSFQKYLLQKISDNLPKEKENPYQIRFSSEKRNPGTFIIDGLVRIAKTGSEVGSPIFINSDLLYSKNEVDGYVPLTIPEAVAVLIHELGHHYGHNTHEELDLIGVRVSLLLQQKLVSTPLVPWNSEISLTVLNPNLKTSFPEILLNVGEDVVDISALYERVALCYSVTIPIPVLPIPDIELLGRRPVGSLFHNVHWDKFKENGETLRATIVGNISNYCLYKPETGALRINDYKMAIDFVVYKLNGKWIVNEKSIKLNQYREPWYKIIGFPR